MDMQALLGGIQIVGREELRKEMVHWEKAEATEIEPKVVAWRTWASVGIAAVLVLSAGAFFFWPAPSIDTIALFKEYYEPYPNVVMPLVRGTDDDSSQLAVAYRAYSRLEFKEAAQMFENIEAKDTQVYFYLGQCYLSMNEAQKAVDSFSKGLENRGVLSDQTEWFLALSYLKSEKMSECKRTLEMIVSQESPYKTKANDLLTKLK